MSDKKKTFLKLVWNSMARHSQQRQDNPPIQMELFNNHGKNSIVLIHIDKIDWKSFENTLGTIHPSVIVDMRVNPRFDSAGFTRKNVFSEIEKIGAKYFDVVELLGLGTKDKDKYIDVIEQKLFVNFKSGPFAFIFENKDLGSVYEDDLIKRVRKSKDMWTLSVVP